MPSEQVWTTALNLSGFEVVAATVEQAERTLRLTVVPKHPVAVCTHCGRVCDEVHQTLDLDADKSKRTSARSNKRWGCRNCAAKLRR
jgi:transcriptional regulator